MNDVVRIGMVGDIVNTITRHFDNDNIAEICVTFKGKDGATYRTWSENESFLVRVGMVESLKHYIFTSINK